MDQSKFERFMPVLAVVVVVLALASTAFFYFNRNAALKRQLLLPVTVLMCLVVLVLLAVMGAPRLFLPIAVPVLALAVLVHMRTVHFCDACGRTLRSHNPFSTPKFCPGCGAALKP